MGRLAASEASPVVDALLLEVRVQPLRVVALHMHIHSHVVANEGNAVGLPEVHLRETDKCDKWSDIGDAQKEELTQIIGFAGFLTD